MLEAYRNKDIKPVPVKSISQQSITLLHRVRSSWAASRTARINMIRGLLRELGIFIPVGARKVVPRVLELLEDADSPLPDAVRNTWHEVCLEIRDYEQRMMRDVEKQLEALSKQIPHDHSAAYGSRHRPSNLNGCVRFHRRTFRGFAHRDTSQPFSGSLHGCAEAPYISASSANKATVTYECLSLMAHVASCCGPNP